MARVCHSVWIVAVGTGTEASGMTATAVMSVTDAPPTLAVCVNESASIAPLCSPGACISLSLVSAGAESTAIAFATRDHPDRRIAAPWWDTTPEGFPVLSDAVVVFTGRIENSQKVGTHRLLLMTVAATSLGEGKSVLTHGARRFQAFEPVS